MDKLTELREKANRLPLLPGVYIMRDARGTVIYVGKAKALKNRVTSYFRGEHLPKVAAMVRHVDDFSVIVAKTEFEALILENSLIKRHQPHYNILLRDDKTYPYLRLSTGPYPEFTVANYPGDDGAQYFGPFGSRGTAKSILAEVIRTLRLPACSRKFPRDLGRDRPCLNFDIGRCAGWCRGEPDAAAYGEAISQAVRLLKGDTESLLAELTAAMETASERLEFEQAALYRDRIGALRDISNRQAVVCAVRADTDAVGFCRGARCALVVLHYAAGTLAGKDTELLPEPLEPDAEAISSLLRLYYEKRGAFPKELLLPAEAEEEAPLLQELFSSRADRRVTVLSPKRGAKAELLAAARRNAAEESERASTREEKQSRTLQLLGQMLSLPAPPVRVESYDISNTGNTEIVSAMVVFENGRPLKRAYRKFHMKTVTSQDDFSSMRETVLRRVRRAQEGDESFLPLPSLMLIDGGAGQVGAALSALEELGVSLPVFGMVKDDRHRTRALTDAAGREIGLKDKPAVFAWVGSVQEETHRFAITYHRSLRDKPRSALDAIPGIGEKRKSLLLKKFRSLKAIREAELPALSAVLPAPAARAVYNYFHPEAVEEEPLCE